jgi:epoxyqueuosine reductase
VQPSLRFLLDLDETRFRAETAGTALRRARHRGLLRNALVVAGNVGTAELIPRIRELAASGDDLVAEHARWALGRLAERGQGAPDV